jgi:hypothetical protein
MRVVSTKGTQAACKAGQPVALLQVAFRVMPPADIHFVNTMNVRSTEWMKSSILQS